MNINNANECEYLGGGGIYEHLRGIKIWIL